MLDKVSPRLETQLPDHTQVPTSAAATTEDIGISHHPSQPLPVADLLRDPDALKAHLDQIPKKGLLTELARINRDSETDPQSLTKLTYGHLEKLRQVFQKLYDQHGSSRLNPMLYAHLAFGRGDKTLDGCLADLLDSIRIAQAPQRAANATTKDGIPLLLQAFLDNDLKTIMQLLNQGADPNIKFPDDHLCYFGFTLSQFAAVTHKWDLLMYLIEKGADLNSKFPDDHWYYPGFTLSQCVTVIGKLDLLEFLIEKGAKFDPNIKFPDDHWYYPGFTLSQCVAVTHNLDLLKFLIEKGAKFDLNSPLPGRLFDGKTLLEYDLLREDIDLLITMPGYAITPAQETAILNIVLKKRDLKTLTILGKMGFNLDSVLHKGIDKQDVPLIGAALAGGAHPLSQDTITAKTASVKFETWMLDLKKNKPALYFDVKTELKEWDIGDSLKDRVGRKTDPRRKTPFLTHEPMIWW